ncbi:MAG: ATP-binding protein [Methanomassiliicoccaceae archaeon]|nr:ATP-binding protein [Methanomassiliicoccaceae archaeon]
MFIGREKELGELDRLYRTGKFQFPVIYGRRRVGKTTLINEFIKDKKAISFTALETRAKPNLENLSRTIFESANGPGPSPVFRNYQEAMEFVFEMSKNERIILVIDEYPYLARSYKQLASILQMLIDKHKDSSKLFLILCGSSMSFMEDKVMGSKSPLYGRRTAQFKILPFDFFDSVRYFNNFSDEDLALIYGMAGGTPQYLLQMDDRLTVGDNIKHAFLNASSYLFEEPNNLLKQEVRDPSAYNAVISAIADGNTKLSDISNKIGEGTSSCSVYLKNLISLGLIKKSTPITEKSKKKTIYTIEDHMFRFWYRFIPPNYSIIQNGMSDLAFENISQELTQFMGAVFEDICGQYLWHLNRNGEAPIRFTELGKWWGSDPRTKSEEEIDIIATDKKDSALFCECKWSKDKVDPSVLETLVRRSELFRYGTKHFCLFSKNGFSDKCKRYAEGLDNVHLITYEEMME